MTKVSLFHLKITVSFTKSSHQDHGPCYLHLPSFFLNMHTPLLLENKKFLWSLFSSVKLDHRSLLIDIYYEIYIDIYNMINKRHKLPIEYTMSAKVR